METRMKPVPAFYCCYLLRSTVRSSSLYIGSSPHPSRRLAQHNGKVKGGAVRTSRLSLRPWEMICIIAGFPSNIAALQFEWAWHNAHLTKHISAENRFSLPTTRSKTSARTGKTRKKIGRPRTSLMDKLANLHLLLRASYFSKWPLELRFFNDVVHSSWLAWDQRTDAQIRPEIKIILDLPQIEAQEDDMTSAERPAKRRKADLVGKGGVDGIDPTYARFQPVLQKLKGLIGSSGLTHPCSVCSKPIDMKKELYNICLHGRCEDISHVTCLAARFLHNDRTSELVPREGTCPTCRSTSSWSELMCVLTLRTRAEKEVSKLLRHRGREAAVVVAELLEETCSDGEFSDRERAENDVESNLSDALSITSREESCSPAKPSVAQPGAASNRLEIVIEDSEDEL